MGIRAGENGGGWADNQRYNRKMKNRKTNFIYNSQNFCIHNVHGEKACVRARPLAPRRQYEIIMETYSSLV